MFNIQRKNLVDKRKMKTAKDNMEIHTGCPKKNWTGFLLNISATK